MTEYEQMLETADAAGIQIIGKKKAAQLMAVVYLYGDESAVYSRKMNADISYIAKRYGIFGGAVPDPDFIGLIKAYVANIRQDKHPVWLDELEERYSVTFPEWSGNDGVRIPESING